MKQFFKSGDKVVCKERYPDSSIYVSWNPRMDEIVGVTGVVVDCSGTLYEDQYVRVDFGGKHETLIWTMDPKWLTRVDSKTQDKMTSPAAKATETFTTTWSLDITLTDGKVTAVNVHPPAPPEPQKPKFAMGDIVVCKVKPREMPKGYEWTNEMTLMLNVPGRVAYIIDNKSKIISVEFGGYQQRFAYPEECLEQEEPKLAGAMKQLFARLDKEKKSICIGTSASFN